MRLLKRFMPTEDRFLDLFERHAAEVRSGAAALRAGLSRDGATGLAAVSVHEEAADGITRDVLLAVRKAFITPFDRGAIKDLITAMDDSIDEMNKTTTIIDRFGITEFSDDVRAMADRIVSSTDLVAKAVPLLRSMGSNANEIIDICGQVVVIEGEADAIHAKAVKELWEVRDGRRPKDPDNLTFGDVQSMEGGLERFLVGERLLDRLENVMDRLEDVADVLHGIVIEHV